MKIKGQQQQLFKVNTGINISEEIDAMFDSATDLMSPTSVVYGGAVRDCIAGLPIQGDLDISVHREEFGGMVSAFDRHPRWIPLSDVAEEKSSSGSIAKSAAPIGAVYSFKTFNERVAQLIKSGGSISNFEEDMLLVVRNCDIVCCGLAMAPNGNVYEIIKGATEDCKNKVLRLNPQLKKIDLGILSTRVKKLEERGWKNEIDFKKVERMLSIRERKLPKRTSPTKRRGSLFSTSINEMTKPVARMSSLLDEMTRELHVANPWEKRPIKAFDTKKIYKTSKALPQDLASQSMEISWGEESIKAAEESVRDIYDKIAQKTILLDKAANAIKAQREEPHIGGVDNSYDTYISKSIPQPVPADIETSPPTSVPLEDSPVPRPIFIHKIAKAAAERFGDRSPQGMPKKQSEVEEVELPQPKKHISVTDWFSEAEARDRYNQYNQVRTYQGNPRINTEYEYMTSYASNCSATTRVSTKPDASAKIDRYKSAYSTGRTYSGSINELT